MTALPRGRGAHRIVASTIWRLEHRGAFPKRIRVSVNVVAWVENDVVAWLESRIHGMVA